MGDEPVQTRSAGAPAPAPPRQSIYADYNATTPVDPGVLSRMLPFFSEEFGNAASAHAVGRRAALAIEKARAEVAELIGAAPGEILFTSGGTEANNLAIQGVLDRSTKREKHLITCSTEHKSVLDCARHLQSRGVRVSSVPVDANGKVDPAAIAEEISDETCLVSVMIANNELGTVHPIQEIARITREQGIPLHCDGAQAAGKIPVDVGRGIDLLTISAHKFYGPKGIGALYVSANWMDSLSPIIHGGGHEGGFRSGTPNTPGIVGLGAAASLACNLMEEDASRLRQLRDDLWQRLVANLSGVTRNGHPDDCLPGTLNVSFEGIDGEALVAAMPDIAVSSGSACSSSVPGPSHVITALGHSSEYAETSIRISLGRYSTEKEVAYLAARLVEEVVELRARLIVGGVGGS